VGAPVLEVAPRGEAAAGVEEIGVKGSVRAEVSRE
jgi:hypothetical protein